MRNLLLFAMSSIFVTLFIGIPFDPMMPLAFLANMLLSLILPICLAVLVAFSPTLTFRQIYPVTIGLSALGVLAMILSINL
jgi:energy-converting hydrogenase B subunit O